MCVCSVLIPVWLFVTPCSLPGSSDPWNFPGKSTGVGSHFLLQGIFLTQGSNLCLLQSSCPQSFPASESFPMSQLFTWGGQNIGFSFSISPSNEHPGLISFRMDWFDLQCCPRDSQESSPAPLGPYLFLENGFGVVYPQWLRFSPLVFFFFFLNFWNLQF